MNDGDCVCFHSSQLVVSGCFSSLAIPSLSLVTLNLGGPLASRPPPPLVLFSVGTMMQNERERGRDTTAKIHRSPAENVLFPTLILFFRHLVNGRPSPSIIPPPLFTVFCLSILHTSERHRDYHRKEPKFVNGGDTAAVADPLWYASLVAPVSPSSSHSSRRHVHHRRCRTIRADVIADAYMWLPRN
jgi:hypothetical protein